MLIIIQFRNVTCPIYFLLGFGFIPLWVCCLYSNLSFTF